jgi:ATP-dependent helicase/nuclease subunit B
MAHDYAMLACAAPEVILSCPRRREGAPTVPARWLVRLEAYLDGQRAPLPMHPSAAWARLLDQPAGEPRPAAPPQPRPPVDARPRRLSVTEVETWLRDPYAIYAKHVLRLRALSPLEESADAADYGSIVHAALADFLTALPPTYPRQAAALLRAAMDRALDAAGLRPALTAWWRPRLARIAEWVAEAERQRRLRGPMALVRAEVDGRWSVPGTGRPFVLSGRADRIERRADGTLAILDYKTGAVPTAGQVEQGLAPQLPLEAAMAAAGVFGPELEGRAAELTYWHLSGGFEPGKETKLFKHDPEETASEAAAAERALIALVAAFDDPSRAYLSRPHPGAAPRFSDYTQLARVAEWAALEDDE